MTKIHSRLSKEGERRRQEILCVALGEARRVRIRRRCKYLAVGVAVFFLSAVSLRGFMQDEQLAVKGRSEREQFSQPAAATVEDQRDSGDQNSDYARAGRLHELSSELLIVDTARTDELPSNFDWTDYIVNREVEDLGNYVVERERELPVDFLLDDQQLIRMLADLGKPSALARAADRVVLTQ